MKTIIYSISFIASALFVNTRASAQAELQVIHNAADPAAATVDIYVNGTNAIDDFAFRSATPFLPIPSGVPINIGVAPGNSTSVNDTLKNFTVTLVAGTKYVAIARGVLTPASFAANPGGLITAFDLTLIANAQTTATIPGNVDLTVHHGATDAPAIDVIARNVATLVDNVAFSDATPYFAVPAGNYLLDITPATNNSVIVASYEANLTGLSGGAAVVFASGFLDPSANQNGAPFGLFAALSSGTVVQLPQTSLARLQVIHNAADPGAASVDVYLNGTLALASFAFRTATPFLDVPGDVIVNIGIAAAGSTNVNDTLVNFPVQFANGQTYVAVANGVLNSANFAPNPNGVATGFNLLIQQNIRESALNSGEVDFIALHGATDAPTVDVIARNVGTLVNDVTYTDFTPYISVPPASYLLDVTPGSANNTIVASFTTDLSTLAGSSAVVFASGFLTPSANQNGEAFGLFAALANGTVVAFPQTSLARLQVIHNAADPVAAQVDVYLNGTLVLNDFAFRTATPFLDVPGDVVVNIGIAASASVSVNDTIVNFPVQFTNGQTYVAIANGVLTPSNFAVNPDGISTGFTLLIQQNIRESAVNAGDVDFIAVHGASDAPAVDVIARNVATLVDDAFYTDITPYITVPPASYLLDVTPASANNTIVASFTADLSGLAGSSAVVFASGFLTPSANQNGEAFGLFAALPNGSVVAFPQTSLARLQVIHNAADPAAAIVDVYVNGALAIPAFAFRTATPFLNVPGDVNLNIGIAPGGSTGVNDTIANFPVQLVNGQTYLAIANGVLNPVNFASNPDGLSTAFNLWFQQDIRESSSIAGEVDFIAVHGASDAPTVDVQLNGIGSILVDDAAYGDFTSYLNVAPAVYTLDVTPGNNNSVILATYLADLSGLADGTAVLFASGFLNPSANQNGAGFGLWATLTDGTTFPLPVVTGIFENNDQLNNGIYPNPSASNSTVTISNTEMQQMTVEIFDTNGKIVMSENISAGKSSYEISTMGLTRGVYYIKSISAPKTTFDKLIIQ